MLSKTCSEEMFEMEPAAKRVRRATKRQRQSRKAAEQPPTRACSVVLDRGEVERYLRASCDTRHVTSRRDTVAELSTQTVLKEETACHPVEVKFWQALVNCALQRLSPQRQAAFRACLETEGKSVAAATSVTSQSPDCGNVSEQISEDYGNLERAAEPHLLENETENACMQVECAQTKDVCSPDQQINCDKTKDACSPDQQIECAKTKEGPDFQIECVKTKVGPDLKIECAKTKEGPDQQIDCSKTKEGPDLKIDCTKTKDVCSPDQQIDCTKTKKDPDFQIECVKTKEGPDLKIECAKTKEGPDFQIDCSKTKESPDLKIECTKTKGGPDQQIECVKTKEGPDLQIECSKTKESPDLQIECTETKEGPDLQIECSKTKEGPDLQIDCSKTKEGPDLQIECVKTKEGTDLLIDCTKTKEGPDLQIDCSKTKEGPVNSTEACEQPSSEIAGEEFRLACPEYPSSFRSRPKQTLMCVKCGSFFPSLPLLQLHSEQCFYVVCKFCQAVFPDDAASHKHMAVHAKTCEKCHEIFHTESCNRCSNSELSYVECNICSTRVKSARYLNLKQHLQAKHGTNNCSVCRRYFPSHSEMLRHKAKEHSDPAKTPTCEVCNKTFSSFSRVSTHLKNVHKPNLSLLKSSGPLPCKFCGRCFQTQHGVTMHIAICHLSELMCKICHMQFKSLSKLDAHVCKNVETLEKTVEFSPCLFLCSLCDFTTPGLELLEKHVATCQLTCRLCGSQYETRQQLEEHHTVCRTYQASDQARGPNLASEPARGANLNSELVRGPNSTSEQGPVVHCELCNKSFSSQLDMKLHVNSLHFVKYLLCRYCRTEFTNKVDYLRHMQCVRANQETGQSLCCGAHQNYTTSL